jgi:hypothetical protein
VTSGSELRPVPYAAAAAASPAAGGDDASAKLDGMTPGFRDFTVQPSEVGA